MSSKEFPSVFKNEKIWVIHKPRMTHYDNCLPPEHNSAWKAAHRLDFETSGLLLHARDEYHSKWLDIFKNHGLLRKKYIAGSENPLAPELLKGQVLSGFIASRYRKSKKTHFFESKAECQGFRSSQPVQHSICSLSSELADRILPSLGHRARFQYEVDLISGARHQIRSYFKSQGSPLSGDPLYGTQNQGESFLELHAWKIIFPLELQKFYELPPEIATC